MANGSRPNYFLLLGIDHTIPWDQAAFAARLRAKRGEWSKAVMNGVKTSNKVMEADWARQHLDDIELVMTNPDLRGEESDDADRRLRDERERQRVDFDRDLRIMMSKGFLWDAEVAALRRNYPDLVKDP